MSKFSRVKISLVCPLKSQYSCFCSHFSFHYFSSVDTCLVCIVSERCYQSSAAIFFYVAFESVPIHWRYLRWLQIHPSFFSWHIQSVYVISEMEALIYRHDFSCYLVSLFKFFPRSLQEWSQVFYKRNSPAAFNIPKYLKVSFSPSILIFPWFSSRFLQPSVISCFSLFVWRVFLC